MSATSGKKKLVFWGTPEWTVPILKSLIDEAYVSAVVTRVEKYQGRGRKVKMQSPIKAAALEAGLPVIEAANLDVGFIKDLSQHLPATFLVVAFGMIIPRNVLELSELPAINIHPSMLPLLRGPSPIRTAILQGNTETGVSLMQIDEEVDHGPLITQQAISVSSRETTNSLTAKVAAASVDIIRETLPNYLLGRVKSEPQQHSLATFSKRIESADGRINPNDSVIDIDRHIRALHPRPGAYLDVDGSRLKICEALPRLETKIETDFARLENGNLGLRCADGVLEIVALQPEGKKSMGAMDFLNGNPEILRSSGS